MASPEIKSARIQAQLHSNMVEVTLEIQSQFHLMINQELSSGVSAKRLRELQRQLTDSSNLTEANQSFENARKIGMSDRKVRKLVKDIDRVTADRANILRDMEHRLRGFSSRSATLTQNAMLDVRQTTESSARSVPYSDTHAQLSGEDEQRSNTVAQSSLQVKALRSYQSQPDSTYLTETQQYVDGSSQKSHSSKSRSASHKSKSHSINTVTHGSDSGRQVAQKESASSRHDLPPSVYSQSSMVSGSHRTRYSDASIKSHASSIYRAEATKAAAAVAAAEAVLRSELEAKKMEEELSLLELKQREEIMAKRREIAEVKLRGEVEAKKVQQRAFENALAQQQDDELRQSMLRPPSHASHEVIGHKQHDSTITPVSLLPEINKVKASPESNLAQKSPAPVTTGDANTDMSSTIAKVIGETMAAAMTMNRTHMPVPAVFTGDPLDYSDWKIAFQGLIGSCPYTPLQKLHLLRDYVDKEAKDCVKGYFSLQSPDAYQDALDSLDKEFGSPELIEERFLDKLEQWPRINGNDSRQLKQYGFFLNQCVSAMKSIPGLKSLHNKRNNKKLIHVLPDRIRDRWIRNATSQEERANVFPDFLKYAEFIAYEARVACNSLGESYREDQSKQKSGKKVEMQDNTEKRRDKKPLSITLKTTDTQPKALSENNQHSIPELRCLYCTGAGRDKWKHETSECFQLAKLTTLQVQDYMSDNNLCFACVRPGHSYRVCPSKSTCRKCDQTHPTVMHARPEGKETPNGIKPAGVNPEGRKPEGQKPGSAPDKDGKINMATSNAQAQRREPQIMSMTVPVWVSSSDEPDNEQLVYALLDSQSDVCFITKEVAKTMKCNKTPHTMNLTTMTTSGEEVAGHNLHNLRIRGHNSKKIFSLPNVFTRERIPAKGHQIPTADLVAQWPHLEQVATEMTPDGNIPVGLLVGFNPRFPLFLPREAIEGKDGEPYAVRYDLGWVVMGDIGQRSSNKSVAQAISHKIMCNPDDLPHNPGRDAVTFTCTTETSEQINTLIQTLEQDFKDFSCTKEGASIEDRAFLSMMAEHTHMEDGHVTMPLPLKSRPLENNSLKSAQSRFNHLQRKFSKDTTLASQYHAFMSDLIQQGEAERVPDHELNNQESWYIPHFEVWHPKKPGKIRVVFDGSAKTDGKSINDYLMQGPDLMNSLAGILLRFRQKAVGITCDIERMYHQFRVERKDRDYLRFLWFDDHGGTAIYRMKVHIFGAKSSPGCATYGLRYIAQRFSTGDPISNQAQNFIEQNFYVDDGLLSLSDPAIAIQVLRKAMEVCQEGSVRLHKILSDNREVVDAFPKSERTGSLQDLDLNSDALPTERTLGIAWNADEDCFQYKVDLAEKPSTRRGVLSNVASVFDPLGLISPVVLQGKMILQDMCRDKLDWDDPLSPALQERWTAWKAGLKDLDQIKIPRCYIPPDFGEPIQSQLHTFSDASTKGYGQCTYLRFVNEAKRVHVSLVSSKARVAPIKAVTIPRLELQAARSAVELCAQISDGLALSDTPAHYYSDSEVVLGYIKNTEARYHTYVANRVEQIRDASSPDRWRYVPTHQNPADHTSRGLRPDKLSTSNWFTGPDFLWKEPIVFPNQPEYQVSEGDEEVRVTLSTQQAFASLDQRITRYASLGQALKIVTRIQDFLFKRKQLSLSDKHTYAVNALVRSVQSTHFAQEIDRLRSAKSLHKHSSIVKLDPFLDAEGLLRVGGRLHTSDILSPGEKHPLLLPKASHLTGLIIQHYHKQTAHLGVEYTLAAIRTQGFWIPSGKSTVSSYIRGCVPCKKIHGQPQVPQMATLPASRTNQSPPFTHCGIDCFGPFLVKDARREVKRYGLIVTCMASRAIHIELLEDMSTDSFINAVRAIMAIRGQISTIKCDRGTNFVGASKDLQKMNIEMSFNPPHSSNMGGVWERQIRTIRNVLKGLGRKHGGRISTALLRIVFYEVMAIINCRPLGAVSDDNLPLCPNMLLTMKSSVVIPPPSHFSDADIYSRKRWRAVQQIANEFWQRWRKEYLLDLQARQKWVKKTPAINVGDIVIVCEDDVVRNEWRMARVCECIKSHDGQVRSARLLIGSRDYPKNISGRQYLTRPVSKLIVLLRTQRDHIDEP